MTAILAALVVAQTPANLFDRSLAAHGALKNFVAQIVSTTKSATASEKISMTVVVNGNDLLYRLQMPPKTGQDRIDLAFLFKGNKMIGYDSVADEQLTREAVASGGKVGKIMSAIGSIDESVSDIVDPSQLRELYSGLRHLPGWKQSRGPGLIKLVRSDSQTYSRVAFDSKRLLLRELYLKKPKTELHWTVAYLPPKTPALTIPRTARKVQSFAVSKAPPVFANTSAKATYNALLTAAKSLKTAKVRISGDDADVLICYDSRKVRETQGSFAWAFDGKYLTVRQKNGTYAYGPCRQSDVIDLVGQLGGRVDAFTRNLILRRVPYRNYFESGDSVTVTGSVTVAGVRCSILRSISPGRRTSVLVRSDTHLPMTITNESLDRKGKTIEITTRNYSFTRPTASDLQMAIPAGARRISLPAPQLSLGR
jgi:hypothetical protein